VEWLASREDHDHADEIACDDKSEPDVDRIAIPLTKAILSTQ
jgi:hypothetical protein